MNNFKDLTYIKFNSGKTNLKIDNEIADNEVKKMKKLVKWNELSEVLDIELEGDS